MVLWMNFQRTGQFPGISKNNQNRRTGQFQVFQKTIRIQELASSRYFKKQSESKNWPVPGVQTPQRTGDFHERTGERASYISISSV
jgi:hypothetical protein